MSDAVEEGKWIDSNNQVISYTNWDKPSKKRFQANVQDYAVFWFPGANYKTFIPRAWDETIKTIKVDVICETDTSGCSSVFPTVNPVDKCTLKSAVQATIGGNMYCLNVIGESKYSTAEAKCRSRNAKLPMPRSAKENADLLQVIKGIGLDPDHGHANGMPIILGMVDSSLGSKIGMHFLYIVFLFIV